jgi:hypothetical protein
MLYERCRCRRCRNQVFFFYMSFCTKTCSRCRKNGTPFYTFYTVHLLHLLQRIDNMGFTVILELNHGFYTFYTFFCPTVSG